MANPLLNDKHLEQGRARPGLGCTRPDHPRDTDHRRPDQLVAVAGHDRRWHDHRHRRVAGHAARRRRRRLADGSRQPGARSAASRRWRWSASSSASPASSPSTSGRCGPSSSAPVYAVGEGFFLGVISKAYESTSTASSLQAVGATLGVFAVMLVLYRTQIIKVTDRFRTDRHHRHDGSDGVLPLLVRHQPVRWRRLASCTRPACSASASASSPPAWRR